jgi:hypothetical protein
LSGRTVKVHGDPALFRRRGLADSRADIGRIVSHTGWQPAISWEQSLADLWNETRSAQPDQELSQGAAA